MKAKTIPNHYMYSASKNGRIWSKARGTHIKDCLGRSGFYGHSGKWLRAGKNSRGYLCVNLYDHLGSGEHRNYLVHQLILETFVGKHPEGMECRHLDDNKQNNKLNNLCWGTRSENQQDSLRHGTHGGLGLFGERHHNSKITDFMRRMIIYGYLTKLLAYRQLAKMYEISRPLVSKLVTGQIYPFIKATKIRRSYPIT